MRIRCVVPHCACTRGDRKNSPVAPGMEFICRKHWALVPKAWKRRRRLFARRQRRDLEAKMWDRMKRIAIERAVGIVG
jgi:hypothetical protein